MCGISALLTTHRGHLEDYLKAMTDIISHRGPDGFGYFQDENVLLGHRRLAILDLSEAGHQPMSLQNRYFITYNGEVYNYIEVQAELKAAGYSFKSDCDTEVILAAYDKWKETCLDKFNGMFSFVIYDKQERRIFAARDRFGVKPLYYWISPEGFVAFASEIKQLTVLPGWNPRINRSVATEFLATGLHDHSDETFFEDTYQVSPGHSLNLELADLIEIVKKKKLPVRRWYSLRAPPYVGDLATASNKFRNLFSDAVRLRLRADVDVGSCLSGGLDSSSIVCTIRDLRSGQKSEAKQKTFSAYSEHKRFDESHHIETVVQACSVEHHAVTPKLDVLLQELDKIVWHQDEPFGSSSIFAQWEVFKLARKNHCTVMLDGQGSDEQLAGYSNFNQVRIAELFTKGRYDQLKKELGIYKAKGFGHRRVSYYLASALVPQIFIRTFKYLRALIKKPLIWVNAPTRVMALSPYERYHIDTKSLNAITHAQMTGLNLQMLLRYEDRDSMAHSIEARIPFLDFRLAEFIESLPSDYKLSDGISKRVLRNAMTGILPLSIQNRTDKLGFATAEEIWMTQTAPDTFRRLLQEAIECSGGLIRPQILKRFDRMVSREIPFDFSIWRCISLGLWIKKFKVGMT